MVREDDFLASPGIKSDPTGPGSPGAALHLSTLPVAHMRSWPLRTRGRAQGVGPTGTATQKAALHREDEGRDEAGRHPGRLASPTDEAAEGLQG